MPVEVLSESKTRSEILKVFDKLAFEDLSNQGSLLAENKNIFSDYFQKFLYMNFGNYHRRIILPMIAKNLMSFERFSAGSANIALKILEQTVPVYMRSLRNSNTREVKEEIQKNGLKK